MDSIIRLEHISKNFRTRNGRLDILRDINLDITSGEFVGILGQSGGGKSTLLNILGFIDDKMDGTYFFCGQDSAAFSSKDKANLRGTKIGFVFQSYNLINTMTAFENVELPLGYRGIDKAERRARAEELLEMLGIAKRQNHRPADMSGGEQQRVAIARVMAVNPDVILADEPTGNLDPATRDDIMHIFEDLNSSGKTIIIVTHDEHVTSFCKRSVYINYGQIQ
jgi:putative ABC transport system ATP-binding protein